MGKYIGPKSKIARKFGEAIYGADKVLEKRNYPPGQHGLARKRKKVSEYGTQLSEKQKAKYTYGLLEKQFSRTYEQYATEGTAKFLNEHGVHATLVNKLGENDDNDIPALVRTGKAQAIINTVGNKRTYDEDGAAIRSSAIEAGIPLFTALDTADAMVRVLESRSFTTEAI